MPRVRGLPEGAGGACYCWKRDPRGSAFEGRDEATEELSVSPFSPSVASYVRRGQVGGQSAPGPLTCNVGLLLSHRRPIYHCASVPSTASDCETLVVAEGRPAAGIEGYTTPLLVVCLDGGPRPVRSQSRLGSAMPDISSSARLAVCIVGHPRWVGTSRDHRDARAIRSPIFEVESMSTAPGITVGSSGK